MNEIQLTSITVLIALVWGALLLIQGTEISPGFFSPITNITGILLILFGIFNKWAWRWKIFYPWLVKKPYLQGTWKGAIISDLVDPITLKSIEPLEVYMVIVQDYAKVNAFLLSRNSRSELLSGEIIKKLEGDFQFIYIYRNTPKLLLREKSPIHFGGVILDIAIKPKLFLEGQYWTDRKTKGQLVFELFSKDRFSTFEEACKGNYLERQKI